MSRGVCKIEGCGRVSVGRGLCEMHWARWRRTGDPMGQHLPSFNDRFWAKVDKSGECWEWTGAKNHYGYGKFSVRRCVWVFAHRVAWEITNGEIPAGRFVCHRCDNPACVRPDHLFLGTAQDNSTDAKVKQRSKSASHLGRRLTREEVEQMRSLYQGGECSQQQLARRFGVSQGLVSAIVRGRLYTTEGS